MTKEENSNIKFWNKTTVIITVSLVIGFIVAFFLMPYLLTRRFNWNPYYDNTTGPIGDTFGGIAGPIIGFGGVLLTFYAFYIQYQANNIQKKQFIKQEKDLKVERFENKYFEMIKLYKENVNEVDIDGIKSRQAFVQMFDEFKACHYIIKDILKSKEIGEKEVVNIVFVFFYIGIKENASSMYKKLLINYDEELIDKIREELEKKIIVAGEYKFQIKDTKGNVIFQSNIRQPFEGHIDVLGHYFRQIWHTIKYIDNNEEIDEETKKEYVKIFRAQISSYEQLIIYYNALTDLGKVWIDDGLLKKYKLVKNMPTPLADFGPDKEEILGKNYFEWDEVNS